MLSYRLIPSSSYERSRSSSAGLTRLVPCGRYPASHRRPERSIPGLGEHSRELLTELGFNQDEIGALTSSGVVSSMDSGPGFGQ